MGDTTETQAVIKQPLLIGERGLQLQSLDDLWRFSQAVSKSGFAPKGIQTPEAVMIAVQMGLEVGLSPMAALQNIAVINGRPAIYGDAALAVVRNSGLLEEYSEEISGEGDKQGCTVASKRRGCKPMTTTFTVADAKRAGLWGKDGPWKQYPERMLKFRARGFNLRDNFGDVLKGFRSVEEVRDDGPAIEVETVKPPQPQFTPLAAPADDATLTKEEPKKKAPTVPLPQPSGILYRLYADMEDRGVTDAQMITTLKRKGRIDANFSGSEVRQISDELLADLEGDWDVLVGQASIDARGAQETKELALK